MKANEFVKLVGLAESKRIVRDNEIKGLYRHLNVCHVDVDDLKVLLESYELVKHIGGLEKSKFEYESLLKFRNFDYERLKQAISDVESCGGERG